MFLSLIIRIGCLDLPCIHLLIRITGTICLFQHGFYLNLICISSDLSSLIVSTFPILLYQRLQIRFHLILQRVFQSLISLFNGCIGYSVKIFFCKIINQIFFIWVLICQQFHSVKDLFNRIRCCPESRIRPVSHGSGWNDNFLCCLSQICSDPSGKFILFSDWLFQYDILTFNRVTVWIVLCTSIGFVVSKCIGHWFPVCIIGSFSAFSFCHRNCLCQITQSRSCPAGKLIPLPCRCQKFKCLFRCIYRRIFFCILSAIQFIMNRIGICFPARIYGFILSKNFFFCIKRICCCRIMIPSCKGIIFSYRFFWQ